MKKILTAAAVAGSLMTAGISAPAQASDGRDLLGVLAGGIAVGVIANKVHNNKVHSKQANRKFHPVTRSAHRKGLRTRSGYTTRHRNFAGNKWHRRGVGRGHFDLTRRHHHRGFIGG